MSAKGCDVGMSEAEPETTTDRDEAPTAERERAIQDALRRLIPRQATLPIASATWELLTWLATDEPVIGVSLPSDKKRSEILLSAVVAPDRILILQNGQVFQWNSVAAKVKSTKSNGVLLEAPSNPQGAQQLFLPTVNKAHAREIAALFTAEQQQASPSPATDDPVLLDTTGAEVSAEAAALDPAGISDSEIENEVVDSGAARAGVNPLVDRIEVLAAQHLSASQVTKLAVRDVAILEWLDVQEPIRAVAIRVSMGLPLLEAVVTDTALIVRTSIRNRAEPYVLADIEEVKLKKSEVVVTMRTTKNARVVAGSSFGGHRKTLFLGCVSREHAQELARTIQAGRSRSGLDAQPGQQAPSSSTPSPAVGTSVESRLEDLERLRERGLVSEEEYSTHRERILGDL